jgi:signal transduction histidine kinase
LVDDLLDVSRINQGRIELTKQPVALAQVIAQAVESVEPLLHEKKHDVSITSNCEPLQVDGDFARLVQCVSNVLTNAAKYTDSGGRIKIESRRDGSHAVVRIADNGAGISPDLLPHVFNLFVQSPRTLDRAQGGLGIGLSLVRELIAMHGGEVAAESEGKGRGSAFEIRLPLAAHAGSSPPTEHEE